MRGTSGILGGTARNGAQESNETIIFTIRATPFGVLARHVL